LPQSAEPVSHRRPDCFYRGRFFLQIAHHLSRPDKNLHKKGEKAENTTDFIMTARSGFRLFSLSETFPHPL
jgi:hypothetical protein